MSKAYIITASNGVEVIDDTPEAEIRLANMDYVEERYIEKKIKKQRKLAKNPLRKLASVCGII